MKTVRTAFLGMAFIASAITLPALAQQRAPGGASFPNAPKPTGSPCAIPSMPPGMTAPPEYATVTPMPEAPTSANAGPMPSQAEIAAMQAEGAAEAARQGLSTPIPAPTGSPCAAPPVNGSLLERIWSAAVAFRGTSTAWPGTACPGESQPPSHPGDCACAAAMERVVYNATSVTIGSYSVDGFVADMQSGKYGGGPVPIGMSHRGAIIIWPSHIGVCYVDGCSQTLSNSSSQSRFAPYIGPEIWMGESPMYVWEPQHIP